MKESGAGCKLEVSGPNAAFPVPDSYLADCYPSSLNLMCRICTRSSESVGMAGHLIKWVLLQLSDGWSSVIEDAAIGIKPLSTSPAVNLKLTFPELIFQLMTRFFGVPIPTGDFHDTTVTLNQKEDARCES